MVMKLRIRQAIRRLFHVYGKSSAEGMVYETVAFKEELPNRRFLMITGGEVPAPGVRSFFTANCHDVIPDGQPSWELVMGARHGLNLSKHLARMAAFLECQQIPARPGTLMSDVFGEPDARDAFPRPHAVLVEPQAWKPLMEVNQELEGFQFLQVLPLSDAEWEYARSHGLRALETKLAESDRDPFELGNRQSQPPPIPDWAIAQSRRQEP